MASQWLNSFCNASYLQAALLWLFAVGAAMAQANNEYLRETYQQKFNQLIEGETGVADYVQISNKGVTIYASPADKKANKPEYFLEWDNLAVFRALIRHKPQLAYELYQKKKTPETALSLLQKIKEPFGWNANDLLRPLVGIKIAIDPGHIAGNMETARMEGKYIQMDLDDEKIGFYESEIAWETAQVLKYKLEGLGAQVMLTRSAPGNTAFGITYKAWYDRYLQQKKDKKESIKGLTEDRVFGTTFRVMDLLERCNNINLFQPDLTVVVHYNVDGGNAPWRQPTKKNYNVAFVGGGFLESELKNQDDRFQMLRLLLTDELEKSIELSRYVLDSFESILKVPTDKSPYYGNSLPTGTPGVNSRNLTLTRKVYGIICYGESLYQDNGQECRALNRKEEIIAGIRTSKRVVEVADAYLEGILNFYRAQ